MSTIWNVVRTNIGWTIGAGRTTDFWRDPWIDEVGPLADYIPVTALATIGPSPVASLVDDTGHWKWYLFEYILPRDILLRIAAVKAPSANAPADLVGWRGGRNRDFSLKLAYLMRAGYDYSILDLVWKIIQKFPGIPHVKSFLWILCKRKLMMNVERSNRHFTVCSRCAVCGFVSEDIEHIFKFCPPARQVWSELIVPEKLHDFLSLGISEWIRANLGGACSFVRNVENWNLVFGYTLWNLWLHRNDFTFSNAPGNFGNICDRTKAMVASLDRSTRLLRPIRPAHGGAAIGQGQWSLPQHHWLKVNTGGARNGETGHASCGGVGRDCEGNNVADKLAKNANLDCLEPTFFATPPPWVTSLVIEDVHN
ncbi:hypothetical protein V6N13_103063 [Hibiscus sabdariffa]